MSKSKSTPIIPNLPSQTGRPSGGGRGNGVPKGSGNSVPKGK
ncbi:hypothetical protein [Colwellia sp. MB02u-10]|nr:hypothetical protein [Colwellia sp. MB02u-10]